MAIYISLIRWTDQGRANANTLPDRVDQVEERVRAAGGRTVGHWLTMGRFDQVVVTEAPDDETVAKLLLIIAGRGNAITETLRGFTMDEVRQILQA